MVIAQQALDETGKGPAQEGPEKKIEKRLMDPSILQLSGSAQRRLRERRDTFGYIIGLIERYIDED